jgi:NhaP-type Na+/H+ or K+/H+ antiporter
VLHRLLWAVPAALLLGFVLGRVVGRFAIKHRSQQQDTGAPSDFLALALIALSYVGAEVVGAWGFLAAFAAGVGLRHAELHVTRESPHPDHPGRTNAAAETPVQEIAALPPPEHLVSANVEAEELREPAVAAGVLVAETISFGDTAERMLEVLLVVLVGVLLSSHWSLRAIPLALLLIFVIRPLATHLLLAGSPTSRAQRHLMGWFGIRGIGSLYYLSYAFSHGVTGASAAQLADVTITTIALSILLHGTSARPILARYERTLRTDRAPAAGAVQSGLSG